MDKFALNHPNGMALIPMSWAVLFGIPLLTVWVITQL